MLSVLSMFSTVTRRYMSLVGNYVPIPHTGCIDFNDLDTYECVYRRGTQRKKEEIADIDFLKGHSYVVKIKGECSSKVKGPFMYAKVNPYFYENGQVSFSQVAGQGESLPLEFTFTPHNDLAMPRLNYFIRVYVGAMR